jgi:hypothetical protein
MSQDQIALLLQPSELVRARAKDLLKFDALEIGHLGGELADIRAFFRYHPNNPQQ